MKMRCSSEGGEERQSNYDIASHQPAGLLLSWNVLTRIRREKEKKEKEKVREKRRKWRERETEAYVSGGLVRAGDEAADGGPGDANDEIAIPADESWRKKVTKRQTWRQRRWSRNRTPEGRDRRQVVFLSEVGDNADGQEQKRHKTRPFFDG